MGARAMMTAMKVVGERQQQGRWQQGWQVSNGNKGNGDGDGNVNNDGDGNGNSSNVGGGNGDETGGQ